ncbi:MAG: hypothetical protein D6729_18785, partial [Deltaproteobacteria bacterium]
MNAPSHIRPSSIGEILDLTLRLFRRGFGPLFYTMLVFELPIYALGKIYERVQSGALTPLASPEALAALPADALMDRLGTVLLVLPLFVASVQLLMGLATVALAYGGHRLYLGERVRPREMLSRVLGRFLPVAATYLWVLLLLALAYVGGAVPGAVLVALGLESNNLLLLVLGGLTMVLGSIGLLLTVYLRWFLVLPVMAVEEVFGLSAIRRSRQLMSGRVAGGLLGSVKMRAAVLLAVLFVIMLVPSALVGVPQIALASAFSSTPGVLDPTQIPLLYRLPFEVAQVLLSAA